MTRRFVFFTGLLLTAVSLPSMLEHHGHTQVMAQAWCTASGNAAPAAGWFTVHCVSCPAVLAGFAAMSIAALSGVMRGASLRRVRA